MKKWLWIALCALWAAGLVACSATAQEGTLVVMTHDSFDISAEVIAEFEAQHDAKVTILKSGDAGEALNRVILSKNTPLADVFYGVDNTFLSRALDEDIFEAYRPEALARIPQDLVLDPEARLVPVDWGDVCLNYDRAWFEGKGMAPPASLDDLIDPAYKSLTVVENPATSSPGLAFLLTTIGQYGPEGYKSYWRALRENDVWVENGWSEAYYGQFSAASDGNRPIVVSYATSPAAEVYYSEGKYDTPPTGAVLARDLLSPGRVRRRDQGHPSSVVWPARSSTGCSNEPFQEDIPLHMWVYPANPEAELAGACFRRFAEQAQRPVTLAPEDIAAQRDDVDRRLDRGRAALGHRGRDPSPVARCKGAISRDPPCS